MSLLQPRFWLPSALFVLFSIGLAACNYPTQTAESITDDIESSELEPTASGEIPASPEATTIPSESPTASAAADPTSPAEITLRVAYTDDGDLWAMEVGSDPRRLTNSSNVSELRLSKDGQWIAYTIRDPGQDTAELHSIHFDGSDRQILLDAASFDSLYPLEGFIHYTLSSFDFLPNTHMLLFNTRGVFEGPGLAKNDDLLAIDVATGQITPLLARGEGGDFTPSPPGAHIAIVRPDSIGFVNTNGADLRSEVLTFTPVITYSEFFFYPLPVWSGDSVVLAVPQQDPFFAAEPGTIWSVNGEPQVLAQPDGDLFNPQRELPIVSPDGSKVAYFRAVEAAGEQQLVIENFETGERAVYDTGPFQWKGWSPDSNRWVYSKGSGLDLYLGELSSPPMPLGSGSGLRWISANEYLYLAGVPGSWALTLAELGGVATPLAISSDDFAVFDFAE